MAVITTIGAEIGTQ